MKQNMSEAPVLIAAGGTGGHVYPALVVAEELMQRNIPVVWVGTKSGIEARVVSEAGILIEWLDIQGLRGKGYVSFIGGAYKLVKSSIQASLIIRKYKPQVILGMGGYVTGPVGLAAKIFNLPLVLHEQNAIAGFTNRHLAKMASRVLQAFPGAFPEGEKIFTVGNPVRKNISEKQTDTSASAELKVLIVGGSLGASYFNETMPAVLSKLSGKFSFWHQTGLGKSSETLGRYHDLGINENIKVQDFIDDMQAAYGWADVTVCRSGAMTVSELAVAGMPSILVPFPYAVDDHQTANARFLESADAALIVRQSESSGSDIANALDRLNICRERIRVMSENAHKLAITNVEERVVDLLLEIAA